MSDGVGGPWWVVAAAALPSTASGVWVIWRWWAERHDRRDEGKLSREDRLAKALDEQQSRLTTEAASMFGDLRNDQKDLRDRLAVAQRDANRGWDLARYWHGTAHDLHRRARGLRHDLAETHQIITSTYQRWAPKEMPDIVPIGEVPPIPLGVDDPK